MMKIITRLSIARRIADYDLQVRHSRCGQGSSAVPCVLGPHRASVLTVAPSCCVGCQLEQKSRLSNNKKWVMQTVQEADLGLDEVRSHA